MNVVTEYAAAAVAVLAATAALARVIWLVYRWARRIEGAITYVESEMKFNGGSTMRDSLLRIERELGIEARPSDRPPDTRSRHDD